MIHKGWQVFAGSFSIGFSRFNRGRVYVGIGKGCYVCRFDFEAVEVSMVGGADGVAKGDEMEG